jgi:hypothetical protein
VDGFIGGRLSGVTRLAWRWPGDPADLADGPVHLLFDDGRGVFLDCRSDWSVRITATPPGDLSWFDPYDYDYDGGRWVARDASGEEPFDAVVARTLTGWVPEFNPVSELVGVELVFDGRRLRLTMWEGELRTVNDAGPTVNSTGPTVNSTGPTVNDAGPTVNSTGPTVNSTGPTVNDAGPTAPARPAPESRPTAR